ncbi:DUF2726 domain-containing protein [Corallococcus macrosporus]|uniref:DUF2726 domain-containing protein n=1 Tax=Corallococcus macrosporus TaxID=35 RepID=UPI0009E60CA1|nr:DUF2726 domain-containing protein [Corallococcus macrosporus]
MDRRKKILATPMEESSDQQLRGWATKNNLRVFSQVALAQVLNINNSGLTESEFSYALKASFDFVIARQDSRALFAVEADGEYHEDKNKRELDHLKNSICNKLSMPLIRVGKKAVEVKLQGFSSVLTWIATLFPYAEALGKAYANGTIPEDEIVFPTDIITFTNKEMAFPLNPARKTIDKLWQHVHASQIPRFPDILHATYSRYSAGGVITFALAFARKGTILGIGGCLAGNLLPIPEYDVSEALALTDLEEQISQYVKGAQSPLPPSSIITKMRKYAWEEEWSFDEGDGVHPIIQIEPRET